MKKFVMTAALAAALVAPSANAQTVAELQAQIAALMSQMGTTSSTTTTTSTSATSFKWNGTLIKKGSTGQQVKDLQNCMNALGYSTGVADGIYGSNTYKGITAFQSAKGLMVDGIVGKQTAPAFEAACAGKGTTTTTTTTPKFESSNGEEADVTVDNLKKVDDLVNNKGDQEAFTFEVEADEKGGAAQVERLDLDFAISGQPGGEDDFYDVIEKVTIEVDGKEVASTESSDDDDWQDDTTGLLRISGLDTVVASDETVEFTVLLDIADLDESDDLDLDISLTNIEVRFTDEAGITETESLSATKTVTVEALDAISFDIDENSDNPEDDSTISLDEDKDGVVAFINDVTVEEQDGTLSTVTVEMSVTAGATTGDIEDAIGDATLVFGSDEIDADEITATSATLVTLEFDMDDMELSVDDEFEVSIKLDLNELEDGSTVIGKKFQATTIELEGEDEDGDDFAETINVKSAPELTLSAGTLALVEVEVEGYENSVDAAAKAMFTVELEVDGDDDASLDFFTLDIDGTSTNVTAGVTTAAINGVIYTIELKEDDNDGDDLNFGSEDDLQDADADIDSSETYYIEVSAEAQSGEVEEIELELVSVTYDTFDGSTLVLADQVLLIEKEADEATVELN